MKFDMDASLNAADEERAALRAYLLARPSMNTIPVAITVLGDAMVVAFANSGLPREACMRLFDESANAMRNYLIATMQSAGW